MYQLLLGLFVLQAAAIDAAQLHAPNETETPVIGGQPADILNYPYQVALLDGEGQFCGGSIISPRVVVTAQHCITTFGSVFYVGAGRSRLSDITSADRYAVQYVVNYPRYISVDQGKDIALLFLARDLDFSNPRIKPIGLATRASVQAGLVNAGVDAFISGWGNMARGGWGSYPDQLRAAMVKIVPDSLVDARIGNLSPDQLPAGQFPGNFRVDTCDGDSGGPLAVNGPNGPSSRLLAGVTSWGMECADGRTPGLYARVPSFADWINRVRTAHQSASASSPIYEVATMNLANGAARTFDVVLPRGLQRAHFRLVYPAGQQGRGAIQVRFDNGAGSPDCSSSTECPFITPLEGLYRVTVRSRANLRGLRLEVKFDVTSSSRPASYRIASQAINGMRQIFVLGIPAVPGSNVRARISGIAPEDSSLHLASSPGFRNFASPRPVTFVRNLEVAATASGVVSFMIANYRNVPSTFDIDIDYVTFSPATANTIVFNSGPSRAVKEFPLTEALQRGSELGIKVHVTQGTVLIRALFGAGLTEWSCRFSEGMVGYCSGIVPEHSNTATIRVTPSGVSSYVLWVTYNPA